MGEAIKSFEDLEVWRKGKELVLAVYGIAKDELYGLTSQVKRAALSVPANIAEGFGRYHYMDKAKLIFPRKSGHNEELVGVWKPAQNGEVSHGGGKGQEEAI